MQKKESDQKRQERTVIIVSILNLLIYFMYFPDLLLSNTYTDIHRLYKGGMNIAYVISYIFFALQCVIYLSSLLVFIHESTHVFQSILPGYLVSLQLLGIYTASKFSLFYVAQNKAILKIVCK